MKRNLSTGIPGSRPFFLTGWVLLCAGSLAACAITTLTRIQPDQDPDDYGAYSKAVFRYAAVVNVLRPVLVRQGLACRDHEESGDRGLLCKTWAWSTSSLTILNHQGEALIYVRESLPTLWIPEPYDSIRQDVVQTLQRVYPKAQLECRYGEDGAFDCWQWTFLPPAPATSGAPFAATYFEAVPATMPAPAAGSRVTAPTGTTHAAASHSPPPPTLAPAATTHLP